MGQIAGVHDPLQVQPVGSAAADQLHLIQLGVGGVPASFENGIQNRGPTLERVASLSGLLPRCRGHRQNGPHHRNHPALVLADLDIDLGLAQETGQRRGERRIQLCVRAARGPDVFGQRERDVPVGPHGHQLLGHDHIPQSDLQDIVRTDEVLGKTLRFSVDFQLRHGRQGGQSTAFRLVDLLHALHRKHRMRWRPAPHGEQYPTAYPQPFGTFAHL